MCDFPELSFTTDGADLVVRMPFKINNSAHVLWTSVIRQPKDIHLCFQVIQNRDLFVRSQKEIQVEWRIDDCDEKLYSFHVSRSFSPTTKQLRELLPGLQRLVAFGESFRGG